MKHFIAIIFSLFSLCLLEAQSQNLQLHHDFGSLIYGDLKTRPSVTTTFEMFHPDNGGSTYAFVDMDYKTEGIVTAYWEIARELKFWKAPVAIHVEYDGGLTQGLSFNHAYLLGATYIYNNKDCSKGFTITPSFKYIQNNTSPCNFQITGTWNLNFLDHGLLTFAGFFDFWKEKKNWSPDIHTCYVFVSEPQLWLNLDRFKKVSDNFKMSIGTELELSYNFVGCRKFYAIPTIALKWTFN